MKKNLLAMSIAAFVAGLGMAGAAVASPPSDSNVSQYQLSTGAGKHLGLKMSLVANQPRLASPPGFSIFMRSQHVDYAPAPVMMRTFLNYNTGTGDVSTRKFLEAKAPAGAAKHGGGSGWTSYSLVTNSISL